MKEILKALEQKKESDFEKLSECSLQNIQRWLLDVYGFTSMFTQNDLNQRDVNYREAGRRQENQECKEYYSKIIAKKNREIGALKGVISRLRKKYQG